ncbi:transcription initiation factor TFIID subunit 3 [Uranotaenia lowii]|uniref:transcription initiation factor TFIID subunit 3 n=1 Tax=Uranotaenia lowii TaxID=190385 RepID=UPI00247ACE5F|nr:transcription initiation factor TFIID subunit 3 [Uranotaenia lowii]
MSEKYTHQLLKVVVAQVCQAIGWHSIQSTPMELMIDILDQYLKDITRTTHRYAELYNRTDPNLDDVALAYREMGTNLGELQEYLQFVDPIEKVFEVPKYPLPKETHLNFLKPGSKEVLSRPVHIPEHMPPMLVDADEEEQQAERRLRMMEQERIAGLLSEEMDPEVKEEIVGGSEVVVEKMEEIGAEEMAMMESSQQEEVVTFKRPPDVLSGGEGTADTKKGKGLNDEGRPTREISSVIMTTSGFISPAREGRLPEAKVPMILEEKPKPPPPPPPVPIIPALPISKMEEKFSKKLKKKPAEKEKKKDKKGDKKKVKEENDTASRPVTPGNTAPETGDSSIVDDIKPLPMALDPPPRAPSPLDVKPSEAMLPPAMASPMPIPPVKIPKPKKEKPPKKKKLSPAEKLKSPVAPPLLNSSPLMEQPMLNFASPTPMPQIPPPLLNQISPPKPPKPKKPRLTKKQQQLLQQQQQLQQQLPFMEQFQQQLQNNPLTATQILELFSPGKNPMSDLFPPSLFPPRQQISPQPIPPKFPDTAAQTQLDILQKLHPSLEITPAPGPSSSGKLQQQQQLLQQSPSPDKQKLNIFKKASKKDQQPMSAHGLPAPQPPIIVIDDDKSPPHQPQFPTTPTVKKRAPKKSSNQGFSFQDTFSSPNMDSFNLSMDHPMSSLAGTSFREFSPPKTPSNMPKTPDIKLHSSSSSSASWMSDSGKLPPGGLGAPEPPLFGAFPNFGMPHGMGKPEKKPRKPRAPKQPKEPAKGKKSKNAQLMEDLNLLQQLTQQQQQLQQQQQQQQFPPNSALDKKQLFDYSNLLKQSMPPGFLQNQVRNPMLGMFPLPSGPGLIPDNPLFPSFPGQPSFLPSFGMPRLPPQFDLGNLPRYTRPQKVPSTENLDNLDPETKLAHTPLDLQKSTCNVAPLVPPSLQIDQSPPSKKQKPSPQQPIKELPPQEHSLNLSTKSVITQNPQPSKSSAQTLNPTESFSKQPPLQSQSSLLTLPIPHQQQQQQNIPPQIPHQQHQLAQISPTVPPITSGETIVIGSDSDTNSQSTVTMAAMGIEPPNQGAGGSSKKDRSEKRSKNKEHKRDKKLRETRDGKIKKKKDKKDKNKSKDRDRERPKSSHSFNMDIPDAPLEPASTMSIPNTVAPNPFIGTGKPVDQAPAAPSASALLEDPSNLEQIRRKEKKEKKKEKLKKEKRKEKERAALEAANAGPFGLALLGAQSGDNSDGSSTSVPKLTLKLGGSAASPSPRSGTPDVQVIDPNAVSSGESIPGKREASPELARISALVTRPPKLKTPTSKGKAKDDETAKHPKAADHSSKTAGKLEFGAAETSTKPRPRGIQPLPDSIDLFSVNQTPPTVPSKVSTTSAGPSSSAGPAPLGGESSTPIAKKPPKEPKSSHKAHGGGGGSGGNGGSGTGSLIPAPLNSTPINVKDADGNVVWICPACGRVDDGTPMIGCDGCDAWYHWVCVGIQVPPDSKEDWYCRVCIAKKQESHGADEKQKKRKKKDKKNPKD